MTSKPVRVSVIIPSYNCSSYLEGAVESALRQTLAVHEVIVVDDGSRDDTEAVATELGRRDPRVKYVHQTNAGVSAARNSGVARASGDWIALLDADDRWHPLKLELQMQSLALAPDAAWSLTGCRVIDGHDAEIPGDPFANTFSVFRQSQVSPLDYFGRWLNRRDDLRAGDLTIPSFDGDIFEALFLGNVCLPSSALLKRSALEDAGGFNASLRLAEETEFFHRLSARFRLTYLAGPLVSYRKGGTTSLTAKTNTVPLARNALESMQWAVKYRGGLSDRERATYEKGRRDLLLYMAKAQLAESDPGGARETLRKVRAEGGAPASRLAPLVIASLLPAPALRALQAARRAVRG